MPTKPLPTDTSPSTPAATQDRPDEAPTKSPQAFYEKMVKRPDIREILTRLATLDEDETR